MDTSIKTRLRGTIITSLCVAMLSLAPVMLIDSALAATFTRVPAKKSFEVALYNDAPNVYDDMDTPCVKAAAYLNAGPYRVVDYLNPRGARSSEFGYGCYFDLYFLAGPPTYNVFYQHWMLPRYSCPAGYYGPTRRQLIDFEYYYDCTRTSDTLIGKQEECPLGNPVMPGSGIKIERQVDYTSNATSLLRYERMYRGRSTTVVAGAGMPLLGRTGFYWTDTYSRSVKVSPGDANAPDVASVSRPDGRVLLFARVGSNWESETDIADRLIELKDGAGATIGWQYVSAADDSIELFDATGVLQVLRTRSGEALTLMYSTTNTPTTIAPGRGYLVSVNDAFGRQLQFSYDATGRLIKMVDPDNRSYAYSYAANNTLTSITYPDLKTRTYLYEDAALPFALTGILDENGARYSTYAYDSSGRATTTEHAGGAGRHTLVYGASQTTVTDPLNAVRTYGYTTVLSVLKRTGVSQPCATCGGSNASAMSYDANGNLAAKSDFNGNLTCFTYDLTRNLETKRVEGLSGTTCPGTPGTATRTISTQWHATFRLPTGIAEPKRITTYAYDSAGNVTTKTLKATTDTTGASGFSAAVSGTVRTWTYTHTYHPSITGFITQTVVNGPRTDVTDTTTYAYDSATGSLASITNALGQVTTFSNVDAHGRPQRITDPNGLITDLTYDLRGRLTSRTVGGELTSYDYDGVGQLTKVIAPDGSYVTYGYDDAHRLTQVQDNLGNRIVYTLDAMGNRTAETVSDPSGTLARKRQREYNNLNRLTKDIGGANPASEITQYGYDTQGNLTTITDPLGKLTTQQFDALNRLIKTIEPAAVGTGAGGNIQYAYDGIDQLTQVIDPRTLATSYTVDGLGRLATQVSPDTGTTTRVYDAAGNLTTHTDARGVVSRFTYDALDRLTKATYTGPSGAGIAGVTVTYTYDAGSYGKGRLTGFTDASGSSAYTYDPKGRLSAETRTISAAAYTTQYGYDSAGRLNRITYPSGRTVDTSFDAAGRIRAIDTTAAGVTQSVVSNVTYHPFGAVKSFVFGNATTYSRSFDLSGRISGYTLATLNRTVGFDANARITGFTHNNAAYDQSFGYDNLNRLTGWTGLSSTQGFGYDLTGNRTSLSIGANSYPYTVEGTSNRVTQTAGPGGTKAFTFDAAGNTKTAGATSFNYDATGRMISAITSAGTASYKLNALGQRVLKTAAGTTTRYHYDANGNLIAENVGTTWRDYVWLGSLPVAILEGSSAYFVHADHLDTPRVVTNQANTIVWRWDADPFGVLPASEDPDGNGQAFKLNLRLPGQYFDKETNLHYNTFRDYDPQIGRYVESDPIGLNGGVNTYTYAGADPARMFDPDGREVLPGIIPRPSPLIIPRPGLSPLDPAVPVPHVLPKEKKEFDLNDHCSRLYERCINEGWGGDWTCFQCHFYCTGINGEWPFHHCSPDKWASCRR